MYLAYLFFDMLHQGYGQACTTYTVTMLVHKCLNEKAGQFHANRSITVKNFN